MNDIYYPVAHRKQDEIDSAKDRYQLFDTKYIPEIFKKVFGIKALAWKKPTSWSTTHIIYFVTVENQKKPFVLRANTGKNTPELYFQVEKLATDQTQHLNIPVNKIIYVDVSRTYFPFDFQIQEKLEGQDIEDQFKGSQEEYDVLSFQLGVFIAQLSVRTFDGFGRFDEKKALKNQLVGTKKSMYDYVITCLDEDIKFLAEHDFISSKISVKLRGLFEEYKIIMDIPTGSLVQHDLADHNMFFKHNRITGIYDWEACISGDPVLDLASCPTWKIHYPREKKLIEGFTSIKQLPEHFEDKMNIYRLRTMLWKMVFAIKINILNRKRRQKFLDALAVFKLL